MWRMSVKKGFWFMTPKNTSDHYDELRIAIIHDIASIISMPSIELHSLVSMIIQDVAHRDKQITAALEAEKLDATLPLTDEVYYKSDAIRLVNLTIDKAIEIIESRGGETNEIS